METKKTYKANLENKRTLLTEVGLVAAMGIVLMAFEWGTPETKVATLAGNDAAFINDDIEIPVTMETPPTPPAPAVILNDLIEILPDDIKIDEDLAINCLVAEAEVDAKGVHRLQDIIVVADDRDHLVARLIHLHVFHCLS